MLQPEHSAQFINLGTGIWESAARDLDRAFDEDPSLFQAQIGKAISDAIGNQKLKGLEILRRAQTKIEERGVGDPETIYKVAQAYAVLGDKKAALRMLQSSIENGFFPYSYIASDPLLESLRTEPEFNHLAQRARQRHESFKTRFF